MEMCRFFFFFVYTICIVLGFSELSQAAPKEALVTSLPGFNGTVPSKHYSGYVSIPGHYGKPPQNLFYYFIESERNPSEDPVVLWQNGGPGCSSMEGLVYEHGPFNFKIGNPPSSLPTLQLNEYSWSKVSNIIYLDAPNGVGFSYTEKAQMYATGDKLMASDSHKFLLKWFETFPEFVSNQFYLAGESYAGIYVPTLAAEIVKGIKTGANPKINFKGYMIGNGCTDEVFDDNALVPFAHGMGLISEELFQEVEVACKGNYHKPNDTKCIKGLEKIDDEINGLNIYDILEPCFHNPDMEAETKGNKSLPISFRQLGKTKRPFPVRKRMFGRAWPFRAPVRQGLVKSWPQMASQFSIMCTDDRVAYAWLNDKNVRKAIHTAPESKLLSWEVCAEDLSYSSDAGSMIPYHRNLTQEGYRVLIYSGDHDMCVPYTGSEAWTSSLGYEILDHWRPWQNSDLQVAGYIQAYHNNLTFLTIKGSGHTVPEYKPMEALDFYSRWLEGKPI
ncbi:hypothetical protein UlMin_029884 [Ulmus minor]